MQNTLTYKLARGLGWFSVALGAVEVAVPGLINRLVGAREGHAFIRAFGVREITAGAGILTQSNPAPWMWARVAGDAVDLAALLMAMDARNPLRRNTLRALTAVAGVTLLDILLARSLEAQVDYRQPPRREYSGRSGLQPGTAQAFRTVAQDTNAARNAIGRNTR